MPEPRKSPSTILLLSQVYVPDPTSVGQHMASAAEELVSRGHRVLVFTSARSYGDGATRYPRREVRGGVEIRRLPLSSFGKGRVVLRLLAGLSFIAQVALRGLFVRRLGGVVFSTSPPMCSAAAVFLHYVRRVPTFFWVMDVNPDQAVAVGWASPDAMSTRLFERLNRVALRSSQRIVALDRYMASRIEAKQDCSSRLRVIPPWPLGSYIRPVAHEDNPFREEHALQERFVVMYSGNVGPTSPVIPLLEAALVLQDDPDLVFVLIGGGVGRKPAEEFVAEHRPRNVLLLPYQPVEALQFSLSAADIHVVTMVDEVVGINHPCKVYGAMAAGRPVLFLGPERSHVGDLLAESELGWSAPLQDVEAIASTIRDARATAPMELKDMGARGLDLTRERLSEERLRGELCELVEEAFGLERVAS